MITARIGKVLLIAGMFAASLSASAQTGPFQFHAISPCRIADTRSGARVHVQTRPVDGRVEVAMEFPAQLDFTRAQVQRGLMLVRAIVEPLRVRLELDQDAGETQQIKLTWPAE